MTVSIDVVEEFLKQNSLTIFFMTAHQGNQPESTQQPEQQRFRVGNVRHLSEAIVCLALAVILFRTFQVEGYMISTGSMAPALLGYHKRVICPTCEYPFTFGTAYDDSVTQQTARADGSIKPQANAACPNCGQHSIDLSRVPRNDGDQLLVQKQAYQAPLRMPRRWEVVVFRNPMSPSQAYVKRLVGLPGEEIQVQEGDLYVNGKLERKDLPTQRHIAIPVYDNRYQPEDDPLWKPRWYAEESSEDLVNWQTEKNGFRIEATESLEQSSWLKYRHWIRSGGFHKTTVVIPPEVEVADLIDEFTSPLSYEEERRELTCLGAMPIAIVQKLLAKSTDKTFDTVLYQLYEDSHVVPISDIYGYNRAQGGTKSLPVHDLIFAGDVSVLAGDGQLMLRMTDGRHWFRCVFDFDTRKARLLVDDLPKPLRTAEIPETVQQGSTWRLEMSLIDRQVLLAIDGKLLFAPVLYQNKTENIEPLRRPVECGVAGLDLKLTDLQLLRDVHYTRGRAKHGIEKPYELGPDEYFMLGDNSPVSLDSRSWTDAAVPGHLLLGKPLMVHLPSKPGSLKIGNSVAHFRIPDVSRMRYIR